MKHAHLTFQQYLKNGRPDHVYRGPLIRPQKAPPVPVKMTGKPINYDTLKSAEPATMKPITLTLGV